MGCKVARHYHVVEWPIAARSKGYLTIARSITIPICWPLMFRLKRPLLSDKKFHCDFGYETLLQAHSGLECLPKQPSTYGGHPPMFSAFADVEMLQFNSS
jgi:hypothetical protein